MFNLEMSIMYAVYGSGGFGREVMPLLRDFVKRKKKKFDKFIFIDDSANAQEKVNNIDSLSFARVIKKFRGSEIKCCIAIADSNIRKKLAMKCSENKISLMSVRAINSVVMDEVIIGEGSIINPFATITSNVTIGKCFQSNIYSYIAHDCTIGNFVTFGPGVKCNGNVHIQDNVYVGTGTIIYPGTKNNPIIIGENSKIAAGSVVTKNIPRNVTVFGNPAKILSHRLFKK